MVIITPPLVSQKLNKSASGASVKAPFKPLSTNKVSTNTLKGPGSSLPISRNELKSLAEDLKKGKLSNEEAKNLFVMTVINNSLRNKLGEKDQEQLIHDIKEFFASDPDFVQNLAKNLHDFA